MKRALILGLALAATLSSRKKAEPPEQAEMPRRTLATVEVASPEIEAEVPAPPPPGSGPAQPYDQRQEAKQAPMPHPPKTARPGLHPGPPTIPHLPSRRVIRIDPGLKGRAVNTQLFFGAMR